MYSYFVSDVLCRTSVISCETHRQECSSILTMKPVFRLPWWCSRKTQISKKWDSKLYRKSEWTLFPNCMHCVPLTCFQSLATCCFCLFCCIIQASHWAVLSSRNECLELDCSWLFSMVFLSFCLLVMYFSNIPEILCWCGHVLIHLWCVWNLTFDKVWHLSSVNCLLESRRMFSGVIISTEFLW